MKKYFEFAIDNIVKYGDTDIFPLPIENHIFHDCKDQVVKLLMQMFENFNDFVVKYPPINESLLVSAGYTGFRWATQIDPIWNAYLLGLVLSVSEDIEKVRIPKDKLQVFSYRINLDEQEKTLFDMNYGWREFQQVSIDKAKENNYVLICDISHFYSNIYHHRLENSLAKLNIADKRIEKNIKDLLQKFANITSYGLPIGGQSSRILAELLLNRTDKLLKSKSIEYCRFVDDYHIFAKSKEELYEHLLYLSKILIENEGLSVQKSKTRIMSSDEFISASLINMQGEETNGGENGSDEQEGNTGRQNLFSISLRYDPYSATAEEDYEKLKKEIASLDIVGLLNDELNKSRIHNATMRRLIGAIKYLDDALLNATITSLIDNIEILSPVFPNVMILVNNVFENLSEDVQRKVQETIHRYIKEKSYIMQIELNLAYSLRVLSKNYNDENEDLLISMYSQANSRLIKRDIILIMAKWGVDYWLSDLKNRYSGLDIWEKRSFILASYTLGDEGSHWRDHIKNEFSPVDIIYRDWICNRVNVKGWSLPI